ncbi:hypothetical protein FHS86_001917 [Roseimarinus sediminis]|jgi:hypothetical protein
MGSTKEKSPETYSLRISENALQNLNSVTGYIAYIKQQPQSFNPFKLFNPFPGAAHRNAYSCMVAVQQKVQRTEMLVFNWACPCLRIEPQS